MHPQILSTMNNCGKEMFLLRTRFAVAFFKGIDCSYKNKSFIAVKIPAKI